MPARVPACKCGERTSLRRHPIAEAIRTDGSTLTNQDQAATLALAQKRVAHRGHLWVTIGGRADPGEPPMAEMY
jgi:hypothetical protein